jgi:hypothetical protein
VRLLPVVRLVLAAVLVSAIAGCESTPASPTSPPPGQIPATGAPQLREIKIIGAPAAIHFGTSAALKAVAAYSDGTFVEVTQSATWRSTDPACRVAAAGTLEAVGGATAEITAESAGLKSAAVSVACGHFITIATHENSPTEHVVVPGVQGLVLDGPLAGYTFVTDSRGQATLPPVGAADFGLQFKKAGFENYGHRVTQLPGETSIRIPMVPEFTAQVVFQGQCSSASFQRLIENYNFVTGRTGKVRMTVDLQSDALAPFAELFGTIEGVVGQVSAHASVHERPAFPPNRPVAEMRVGAGQYRMSLSALSGCSPTDFWRATLEYSR